MLRMYPSAKRVVARAAKARGVSTSDYVRVVVVEQARRELEESRTRTVILSAAEQRQFWEALQAPAKLSKRQRQLSRIMRGH